SAEQAAAAAWRTEGLAVLLWALQRGERPRFGRPVESADVLARVGLPDPDAAGRLSQSPSLRAAGEIDAYAAQATVVTWRLRTGRLSGAAWDLVGHLRRQPG